MELLLSKGAELVDAIFYAAKEGHAEAVEWLIDHGTNPNAQNSIGQTPLTDPRIIGNLETVKVTRAQFA